MKSITRKLVLFLGLMLLVFADAVVCSAQNPEYSVKVDESYLALRTAKAFARENEIGELYTGDLVELLDASDSQYWYVYSQKYNCEGYVNKDYLVLVDQGSAEPAPGSESAEPAPSPAGRAFAENDPAEYHYILANAALFLESEVEYAKPTNNTQYTLVSLCPSQPPALLLSQEFDTGITEIHVFQYDTSLNQLYEAEGILCTGVALVGGFRGWLTADQENNGVYAYASSSGTGDTTVYRFTYSDGSFYQETVWSGMLGQQPDVNDKEISWFDLKGIPAYDEKPELLKAAIKNGIPVTAEPENPEPQNAVPAQDDGRTVLQGTIRVMTYEEVLSLQGKPDPNPGYGQSGTSMIIFLLDTPQEFTCNAGDGCGLRSAVASMILISDDSLRSYNGQHITASFDTTQTWWPSDVRVPLGEPGTGDIRILSE